jgi:hypothetical protein
MHSTACIESLSSVRYTRRILYMLIASILFLAGLPANAGMQEGIHAYESKHYRTAIKEFLPLATAGDSEAQYYLGEIYGFGLGVPEDDKKSVDWYTKSAQQENVPAQGMLGTIFLNGSEVIPQDYKQAAYWLTKAAEQNDADAQYNLAIMHHDALGIPQDFNKAVFWYRKAAEHGFGIAKFDTGVSSALLNLGVMYRKGEGVQKDFVKAYMLYSLAASAGNKMAAENREHLEPEMTAEQIREARALAKKWQKKSTSLE